jgi:hypothetical protein
MQGDVELSVSADGKTSRGTVSGSGTLAFQIADATTGSFRVDYSSPDAIVLHLGAKRGLKIGHTGLSIELAGECSLPEKVIKGTADLQLRISKQIAAQISTSISGTGTSGALTVKVTF